MRETTLITGASMGIGEALARECAAAGHNLVLTARSEDKLSALADKLRSEYKIDVQVFPGDLARHDGVADLVQRIEDAGLQIENLINNAGFNVYGEFKDTDLEREEALAQVNMVSPMQLMKHMLRPMVQRGRGRIMNVASTAGFAPSPYNAPYCASKAFVLYLSEGVAEELRGSGVTITALCPGATRTPFVDNAGMQDVALFKGGNVMTAEKVAKAGFRAMMRGKRVEIPGSYYKMLMFSIRLMPRTLVTRIARGMMKRA